jgi:6-phosphogluconolactonase
MKRPRLICFALGIGLTAASLAVSASEVDGRIFSVVSATQATGHATELVALDAHPDGSPQERESYVTAGLGDNTDSPQVPSIDRVNRRLFVPDNTSNDLSVFAIEDDGTLTEIAGSPFPAGVGPCFTALHRNGRN